MPDTFTLTYAPDACDTAFRTLQDYIGYGVLATLADGTVLDARLDGVEVDHDRGEYVAVLREWDFKAESVTPAVHRVPLYDDLRMEIL